MRTSSGRRERGAALLLVIAVLAALVAVVSLYASVQATAFRSAVKRIDGDQAERMTEAGLARALAALAEPASAENATTLQDPWAVLDQAGATEFLLGGGSFRLEVVDAASRLNLNRATEADLTRLSLTTAQIESLLDWREGSLTPRPEGAKDDVYNSLEQPYNTALRDLESVDELFLVQGFGPETLLALPTQTTTAPSLVSGGPDEQPTLLELVTVDSDSTRPADDGIARLNVNTATLAQLTQRGFTPVVAAAIIQRRNTVGTYTRLGDVLLAPGVGLANAELVVDRLTVAAPAGTVGLVNVNTATEAVLNALDGMTPDAASAILQRQSTGLTRLGELATVPGVTLEVLAAVVDRLAVDSTTFLVRLQGRFGNQTRVAEAVVRVGEDGPRVIKRLAPLGTDAPAWWRWDVEPTSQVDLGETL